MNPITSRTLHTLGVAAATGAALALVGWLSVVSARFASSPTLKAGIIVIVAGACSAALGAWLRSRVGT